MVKRYCMANKLKRLAIKPITERKKPRHRRRERERFLNEIREGLKVNGRKEKNKRN